MDFSRRNRLNTKKNDYIGNAIEKNNSLNADMKHTLLWSFNLTVYKNVF